MRHRKTYGLYRDIAALLGGWLLTVPFLLLMTGLTLWLGQLPQAVLHCMAALGWGLAAFWAGRCIGLHRRHHGLLLGMLCGGIYWGLRLIGAALLGDPSPAPGLLLWLLLTGMIGGVIGVNTRCKQPPP
ncbi:MAG: TIGR04086 family membrane protein [Oscillospiraceae bacterium]|nr:TIGR04086 family membrane protein [Oscillospiraceae bacterium]